MKVSVVPILESIGLQKGKYFPDVTNDQEVEKVISFIQNSKMNEFEIILYEGSSRITTLTYLGEKSRKDFCNRVKYFLLKNM